MTSRPAEPGFLRVIGLMSGTSLDGVDAALIETDGTRVGRRGASLSLGYDPALRQALYALFDRAAELRGDEPELLSAERALTDIHVEAVRRVLEIEGEADLIGFHGQTLFHAPQSGRTWQIGDALRLSGATGLPVMHDFRSDDVRAGGEGAPLAPWYHAACLAGQEGPVAILNIGGVANVTFVGRDGAVLACDTGPGNALLDDWALRHTGIACDRDGALAFAGKPDLAVVSELLSAPFFRRLPPKSLDRQAFIVALDLLTPLSPADGAATLVAFTVQAIAATTLPEAPRAWFVCGGGRHNPALMQALGATLPGSVEPVEALGWDGDMVEAECFAYLAMRSLRGLPLSAPGITGAPGLSTGGRLSCAAIRPPTGFWQAVPRPSNGGEA
ncbi:anhydro-N-acetylmuramic acid kinase [Asaia sp. BMEF1]|uniref:anhydro-N-acetylmuramic acid kinase n=1 Tax=Asaia sp. BMEF1 TaxID=3155932 RepID=UPI003F671D8D